MCRCFLPKKLLRFAAQLFGRYITFSKNFRSLYSINLCQHFCPWWVGKIKDNCGQNGGSMFRIDPGTTVSSRMINNDSYQRFHTHSIFTPFKNSFKSRVAGLIVEIDFVVTRFGIFNLFGPTYSKEWSCFDLRNIWKTTFFFVSDCCSSAILLLKSVHFKKTVARTSLLSKLW